MNKLTKHSIPYLLITVLLLTSCQFNNPMPIEDVIATEQSLINQSKQKQKQIIELMQQIKDSAMTRPIVYANAFNHMSEYHTKSTRVLDQIYLSRKLIATHVQDMSSSQTADSLFFTTHGYTTNATRYVKAISDYKQTTKDQLYFFATAEALSNKHINLSNIINRSGDTIDWFTHKYKGMPAAYYQLNFTTLENNIINIEHTFLSELLSKPQF